MTFWLYLKPSGHIPYRNRRLLINHNAIIRLNKINILHLIQSTSMSEFPPPPPKCLLVTGLSTSKSDNTHESHQFVRSLEYLLLEKSACLSLCHWLVGRTGLIVTCMVALQCSPSPLSRENRLENQGSNCSQGSKQLPMVTESLAFTTRFVFFSKPHSFRHCVHVKGVVDTTTFSLNFKNHLQHWLSTHFDRACLFLRKKEDWQGDGRGWYPEGQGVIFSRCSVPGRHYLAHK